MLTNDYIIPIEESENDHIIRNFRDHIWEISNTDSHSIPAELTFAEVIINWAEP